MAIGFLIFILTLAIYSKTLSHSIYPGDSGEFLTVAYLKGIAHSPGYPLYSLVIWLFGKLPLTLTFATKINLLSSLFGAGTQALVFLTVFKLTRSKIASIFASLFLAFSYLFWLYSLVTEVFILNVFFAILLIYLGLNFYQSKKTKFLLFFSFIFGLSLTHHHTILLIAPGLSFLLFDPKLFQKPKIILLAGVFFSLGLLPYLYLPWAASASPAYNWGDPKTLEQFFWTVFRKGYGSFTLSTVEKGFAVEPIIFYFSSFLSFGFLAPILAFLGFLSSLKAKRVFFFLFLSFLVSGPIFILFLGLPNLSSNVIAVSERFFLLSHLALSLLIGLGINFILDYLGKKRLALLTWALTLILLAQSGYLVVSNWSKVNQSQNDLYFNFGQNMFASMEKGGILLSGQDTGWMIANYLQAVDNQRPDLKIINFSQLVYPWYRELIGQKYPDLKLPENTGRLDPELANTICQTTARESPVYIDGYTQRINPFLNSQCQFIPRGVILQLFPKNKAVDIKKLKEENDALWSSFHDQNKIKNFAPFDARTRELLLYYSQSKDLLGRYYYKNGQKDWAEQEFQDARATSKENADPISHLAVLAIEKGNVNEAIGLEEEAIKINPQASTSYYNLGKLLMDRDPQKAKKYFEKFLKLSTNEKEKEEVQKLLNQNLKKL